MRNWRHATTSAILPRPRLTLWRGPAARTHGTPLLLPATTRRQAVRPPRRPPLWESLDAADHTAVDWRRRLLGQWQTKTVNSHQRGKLVSFHLVLVLLVVADEVQHSWHFVTRLLFQVSTSRLEHFDCGIRQIYFCVTKWLVIWLMSMYLLFTAQCTLVHMRGLGIACRPSVRLSVCDVGDLWSHRLEILETNSTDN